MQHAENYLPHLPDLLEQWARDLEQMDPPLPQGDGARYAPMPAAGPGHREFQLDQWAEDVARLFHRHSGTGQAGAD